MPVACASCGKTYASRDSVTQHLERMPLCKVRAIYSYPKVQQDSGDELGTRAGAAPADTTCQTCFISFGTTAELDAHLESCPACDAWDLYQPVEDFRPHPAYFPRGLDLRPSAKPAGKPEKFPFIFQRLFVLDKHQGSHLLSPLERKLVIAIVPSQEAAATPCPEDTLVLPYDDHTPTIDFAQYDAAAAAINDHLRKPLHVAGPVYVYCNSGYQRTVPFLTHYLTRWSFGNEKYTLEEALKNVLKKLRLDDHDSEHALVRVRSLLRA
jgi:hypothetical protein